MITALEIENFKGVSSRQRIEFAPLTLLFGANNAGKSTLLQALLCVYELITRGDGDVDATELGGKVIELGGFVRFVHRHDIHRAVIFRVEFETPSKLERFGRNLDDIRFPDMDDAVKAAWIEITLRFRSTPTFQGVLVDRVVFGVNQEKEPLVWLEVGPSLKDGEPLLARVNLGHPIVATEPREVPGFGIFVDGKKRSQTVMHAPAAVTDDWEHIAIPGAVLLSQLRAMGQETGDGYANPGLNGDGFGDGRSLPVFAISSSRRSALPVLGEALRVIPFGDDSPDAMTTAGEVGTFLEMVILGTTEQLASYLREVRFIGPLRTIPPRGFLYERGGRITGWADGLAAWELLLADRSNLVERTNLWLAKLGTGCKIVVQQLSDLSADAEELSTNHVDKTVRRLLLSTGDDSYVLPSEVGAGISQIIPVIVAMLEEHSRLALIEQPEIHVHPAIQVELGDLFIEMLNRRGGRNLFVVETHSEHLILRLLRRIRETTDGELPPGMPPFALDKLSVLYVESTAEGMRVRRLRVNNSGGFTDRWPKGFFAERMEELL